jgi:hypothetical protein
MKWGPSSSISFFDLTRLYTNVSYSLTRDLHHLPLVFALVTLNALQYLEYDTFVYSLVRSKKEMLLDGPHFITGLLTIFK